MSQEPRITQTSPQSIAVDIHSHRFGGEQIDHETSAEDRARIIRREYALRWPAMLKSATNMVVADPYFLSGFNYPWAGNIYAAWSILKGLGRIPLYPLFPVQQYFLDFADPHRKLAVLIEEEDAQWQEKEVREQDELLNLLGWTVFRIPIEVAARYETDYLPESHARSPYGEFEDNEMRQEYTEVLKPQLTHKTLDGFFDWLKDKYYNENPKPKKLPSLGNLKRISEDLKKRQSDK